MVCFALELTLVASTFAAHHQLLAVLLIGIANGLYNGFFWTTQRTLFLQLLGANDAGKRYGNFQIFVTVFLKAGILLGGWLLQAGGLPWILLLSTLVGAASCWWFYKTALSTPLYSEPRISLQSAITHKDKHRSTGVFVVDGFFLFLESHYWTLSLFLLTEEHFSRFGVLVVVLALLFALLFFLIKNTIDRTAITLVYQLAVVLYALSWAARMFASDELSNHALLVLLLVITFCSSFFRLAFNKRFFDIAQKTSGVQYLLIKSYVSQLALGAGFSATAAALYFSANTGAQVLTPLYLLATVLAFMYLRYRVSV